MSIPTNQDFALEVRTDRLATLWKVTLGASIVLGWIAFTFTMLQREYAPASLVPPLVIIGACLLTREFLRHGKYLPAVWSYALGGVGAAALLMYLGSQDLRQIVPFAFPIIVFVVGLLLSPGSTFLLAGLSTVVTLVVPLLTPDGAAFLRESAAYVVVAIGFTFAAALLAAQVTGELYKVTEWALLNYQRERKTTDALFESREALERSLRRSEALSDRLKETNTELEQARAAAEAAKHFRGQFLANMSHELRTPLNAIIGFSETMLKFPAMYDNANLPKAYEGDMNQIYTSGRQLLNLINDILDLSKVDAGKLEIHMGRVEIEPIINTVMGQAHGLIGERPIRLDKDLPDPVPMIWADETRVRQVLLNLYSNAAKFTTEGSIMLMVRAVPEGVQFSVKDTGSGIDTKNFEVIFEEFKQAESTGRDPRSGAGLGLAIARQLMNLMGGRIWVESELGKGSTFHFVVQAYHADETLRRRPDGAPVVEVNGLQAQAQGEAGYVIMRILYVEDNLANLALVQRLARIGNHEIISHLDGETALAHFQQDNPDLVLMDIQLKGALNGLDVVKILRERGHKTPIIALTAYAMLGDRERCLQAGCDEYLPKPLPVEQLVEFFQRYDPKSVTPTVAPVSSTSDLPILERNRTNGQGAITVNHSPTESTVGASGVGPITPTAPATTSAPVANGSSNLTTPETKPDTPTKEGDMPTNQPAPNHQGAPVATGNSGEPKPDITSQAPESDDANPRASSDAAEPPKAANREQPAVGPNTPSV